MADGRRGRRALVATTVAVALACGGAAAATVPYRSGRRMPSSRPLPRPSRIPHGLLGIGDQKPATFTDPRLTWLGVRYARLIVPWDVTRWPAETARVDLWLDGARRRHIAPLIAFDQSVQSPRLLPTPAAYLRQFLAFHARYPWIRDYTPWNEENLRYKPIAKHPGNAALYFNVLSANCPGCEVVAADLLDLPNLVHYVRDFELLARHPLLWGLHNYVDVNRFSATSTRALLAAVKGTIWFTETGGVVWRRDRTRGLVVDGERRAAQAASWTFALAALSPRIRRVYYYQWRTFTSLARARRDRSATWDSGLIDTAGRPRPAFSLIARLLGRDPARAPRAPVPPRRLQVGVPTGVRA